MRRRAPGRPLPCGARPRVDQNVAHGARREPHEVDAPFEARRALLEQPHVRFVHESGGLQRVVGALARHAALGDPSQLVV
jgi:hypothetical protein